MLGRLALLFVVVPLIELVLLIQMGRWVGIWPTVGLVIFTGITGAAIARAEGLRTLQRFQTEVASGRLPENAILDGLSILVGGALLLTPGILTDVLGFSLLFPGSRRLIQAGLRRSIERQISTGAVQVHVWPPVGFGPPEDGGSTGLEGLDPRNEISVDDH